MNPRQRRGVLLMVLSGVVALAVFGFVSRYVADVNSQVGERVTVYRAAEALQAYTTLTEGDLKAVEMPRRWASSSASVVVADLVGRKVGVALEPGTMLTRDVLVPASDLSPTEREIAVNVDAVTGVAGRVVPGDLVDIYAVFADVPGLTQQVRILVRNARIVSVGGQQTVERQVDVDVREQEVLAVTLALEPDDTLAVSYASAFAQEVRLVRLPSGNTERRTDENDLYDAGDLGGAPVPEGAR